MLAPRNGSSHNSSNLSYETKKTVHHITFRVKIGANPDQSVANPSVFTMVVTASAMPVYTCPVVSFPVWFLYKSGCVIIIPHIVKFVQRYWLGGYTRTVCAEQLYLAVVKRVLKSHLSRAMCKHNVLEFRSSCLFLKKNKNKTAPSLH